MDENWILNLISNSPVVGIGFGLGAGVIGGLWWLGGLEKDEADEAIDQLDETLNFADIDTRIEFYKAEILKLESKKEQNKSNEALLEDIKDLLAEMRALMPEKQ